MGAAGRNSWCGLARWPWLPILPHRPIAMGAREPARGCATQKWNSWPHVGQAGRLSGGWLPPLSVNSPKLSGIELVACGGLSGRLAALSVNHIGFDPVPATTRRRVLESGGETGIRTLDRVSPIHAFQACAFNHSAISPLGLYPG